MAIADFQHFVIPLSLLLGWLHDLLLGDRSWLPHPVVGFGKMIAFGERRLNRGKHRRLKGALMAIFLIVLVFFSVYALIAFLPPFGRVGVGLFPVCKITQCFAQKQRNPQNYLLNNPKKLVSYYYSASYQIAQLTFINKPERMNTKINNLVIFGSLVY
jgi:hypothetical protein